MVSSLVAAQARALAHVAARSAGPPLTSACALTVHFHPDRDAGGRCVLAALADEGVYRSQFVTGTSNGGLTAHPGGDRWRWESRLFGGAYDAAPAEARPIYGALDRHGRPEGAAPRFGSAHLRLRPEVLARATFCWPDSVFDPAHFGVAARMGLLAHADAAGPTEDPLDDYVEAQVHGGLRLDRDVEAVVLDPCFRGTGVAEAAARLACAVEWHRGYALPVETLRAHPDYRGAAVVALGEALAVDGRLDAGVIGGARATGLCEEQTLKRLWHCVARFGGLRAAGT